MVAVTEELELTCNDLVFSKPLEGAGGSECLRTPSAPDRLWNKEEEEALPGLRNKMKMMLEHAHPRSPEC